MVAPAPPASVTATVAALLGLGFGFPAWASAGMKDNSCFAVWAEYPFNASVLLNLALWIIVSMLFENIRVAVLALCCLQIF